ncbi:hypothetical protein F980_01860 [Acinetobacter lwoffii NIPH 715]|jgi:hypothetical protein|nr:hypothetical protein F980_01860 [Acinetobacter lwoffii NIPH 715]
MTTHMAWLPTGERIEVTERKCDGYTHPVFGIYTQYEYVDGIGERILPTHTLSFATITRDQIDFESQFGKLYFKPDFSKLDNLMYRNEMIRAVYSLWREAKGLPIGDPEYKATEVLDTPTTQPQYYRAGTRFAGD